MIENHKSLAEGKWYELTLAEQMGNIGSEVGRARRWKDTNPARYQASFGRALDLLSLTLADPRLRGRLKEIGRAKELVCDAYCGGSEYRTTWEDLERYFMRFALMARANR